MNNKTFISVLMCTVLCSNVFGMEEEQEQEQLEHVTGIFQSDNSKRSSYIKQGCVLLLNTETMMGQFFKKRVERCWEEVLPSENDFKSYDSSLEATGFIFEPTRAQISALLHCVNKGWFSGKEAPIVGSLIGGLPSVRLNNRSIYNINKVIVEREDFVIGVNANKRISSYPIIEKWTFDPVVFKATLTQINPEGAEEANSKKSLGLHDLRSVVTASIKEGYLLCSNNQHVSVDSLGLSVSDLKLFEGLPSHNQKDQFSGYSIMLKGERYFLGGTLLKDCVDQWWVARRQSMDEKQPAIGEKKQPKVIKTSFNGVRYFVPVAIATALISLLLYLRFHN